jgi:hypothetical protein
MAFETRGILTTMWTIPSVQVLSVLSLILVVYHTVRQKFSKRSNKLSHLPRVWPGDNILKTLEEAHEKVHDSTQRQFP